ncbi:MAG: hypothetical protein EOP61_17720 [Sphingomonadales bacterium]|nr:MAG: hypothetical protein EOP61_17720 [Sphingomonadales bacterium]
MLATVALVVGLAGAASAQTPKPHASEVLLGLGGMCWEARLPEVVTDTHCFSVARNGHLVMDVHKVRSRSGGVVYEGVTLYRFEEAGGAIRYDYYTSNGGLLSGYVRRDGQTLLFSDAPGGAVTTVWTLTADAYEVETTGSKDQKRRFVKRGVAEPGGF